jgi:biopolymer transport protein ExbD
MAFSSGGGGGGKPMADINTTPLVDVMLVLLIIFMITAPLMAHKVKFSVPIPSDKPNPNPVDPEVITLNVRSLGGNVVQYIWNDQQIDITAAVIRMRTESRKVPQPEFNIKSDDAAPYQTVAVALAAARREGFEKVTLNDLRASPL